MATMAYMPNQQYGGFSLADINNVLRKSKIISRGAAILHKAGVPYAGKIGAVAKTLGYGKKKRKAGKGKRKSKARK